jgi:hypothetical protein
MTIVIDKNTTPSELEKQLNALKPTKTLNARKHLGKVKWEEDALAYQLRKRQEWDENSR